MLTTKGGMTFSEIMGQPSLWQEAIKVYNQERETLIWIKKNQFNQVIFIGDDASYYGGLYASHLFRSIAKKQSYAIYSSDAFTGDSLPFDPRLRTLVMILSSSGDSDESIWATEYIKKIKKDAHIISIVCKKDSPLEKTSDKSIVIECGMDEGIIPISSFSTTLYFLSLMAGALGGNSGFLGEMSKLTKTIDLKQYYEIIIKLRRLQEIKHMLFCGSGPYHGLAGYGSLIMKEMSLTPSQYFNTFEFRHNHYVTTHPDTLAAYILSDELVDQELASMRDAAKMRSQIFLLAENLDEKVEAGVEYSVKFRSGLSSFARAFHIIPCLQLLAFQHTISKGKNPDKPKHVIDVVKFKTRPEKLES